MAKRTKNKVTRTKRKFSDVNEKFRYDFKLRITDFKSIQSEKTEDGILLKKIPVFKTGNHRGIEFNAQFMDEKIIATFSADEDIPIQVDHSEEAFKTLGFVKRLFREGEMMFADMELIDDEAISRWNKRLLKKWSISLNREGKLQEISFVAFPFIKEARVHSEESQPQFAFATVPKGDGFVLLHLINQPAAVQALSGIEPILEFSKEESDSIISHLFQIDKLKKVIDPNFEEGENKMDFEKAYNEMKAELDTLRGEFNESFKTKEEELETANKKVNEMQESIDKTIANTLKASVARSVEELISLKKLVPARKDSVVATLVKLSQEDRDQMLETFKESATITELDETGNVKVAKETNDKSGKGKFSFDGKMFDLNKMSAEDINGLAKRYADKNDLGLAEAQDVIFEKAGTSDVIENVESFNDLE